MYRSLLNYMKNMIKRARVSNPNPSQGEYNVNQIEYMGKTTFSEVIHPYGMASVAPVGSQAIVFNLQNQEENKASIEYNPSTGWKGLKIGECICGNEIKRSYIYFKEDGSIEINSPGAVTVTAGGQITLNPTSDVIINGNLIVTGDITSQDNILAANLITSQTSGTPITLTGIKTAYNPHTHISSSAGNPSSAPTPTI